MQQSWEEKAKLSAQYEEERIKMVRGQFVTACGVHVEFQCTMPLFPSSTVAVDACFLHFMLLWVRGCLFVDFRRSPVSRHSVVRLDDAVHSIVLLPCLSHRPMPLYTRWPPPPATDARG